MAKRRNKDSGVAALLGYLLGFLIIVTIIVAAITLTLAPVFLISGWVFYYISSQIKYRALKGNISDFWLTENEKDDFKVVCKKVNKALKEIEKAKKRGSQEDLSINKDGSFNRKSKLGKDLNNQISNAEIIYDENIDELIYWEDLPYVKWKVWQKSFSRLRAFKYSFLSWMITAVFSIFLLFKDFQEGFKIFIKTPIKLILVENNQWAIFKLSSLEWISYLIPFSISFIVFFIVYIVFNKIAEKKISSPPKVTLSNVDFYKQELETIAGT